MDTQLFEVLGRVAGIGGIALGVFLVLFRELLRKKLFPQLTKQQGFRVILVLMVLTWSVALAGIWAWASGARSIEAKGGTAEQLVLEAGLWRVVNDAKGSLAASMRVRAPVGKPLGDAEFDQVRDWLAERLQLPRGAPESSQPPVTVDVRVPAELASAAPRVMRTPTGPLEVSAWVLLEDGKLRMPLDLTRPLSLTQPEFTLEVHVPGYGTRTFPVQRGTAVETSFQLEWTPGSAGIRLGIEAAPGDSSAAGARLAARLATLETLEVRDPQQLERLREELRAHNEAIRAQPWIQLPMRELGLDYIVSCDVHREPAGD